MVDDTQKKDIENKEVEGNIDFEQTAKEKSETKSMLSNFNKKAKDNKDLHKLSIENEKLQQEITELQAKAVEDKDKVLRAHAEMENVRRRATIDLENAHKFGLDKFSKALLDVVDSMEHGMNAVIFSNSENLEKESDISEQIPSQIQALHDGMELTHKLLLDTLEKFGVKQLNPINEIFDPTYHEALSMQITEVQEPNTVLTVVQKGYLQHDRVLRPARVIIAKEQ